MSFYIAHLLLLYKQGIVKFLCFHPSFYIALLALVSLNVYGIVAIGLLSCKVLDIALKLILLQKIEERKPLGIFGEMIERDMSISFFMKGSVCAFYILFFYIAFNPHT